MADKKNAPKTARKASTAKPAASAAKAAAQATHQINERTINMQNEATQMITDRTQAMFGDINERSKEAMERSARVLEEMTELAKGNVEALVASSKVAARGIETLSQEVAEFGRRSFEEASSAVRSFAEIRSATDFFRMQGDFARSQFDSMVSESSKMSEAMIKLTGEVAEPITSRYSVAAERVKNIAA
jgi:phasin family protein